MKKLFAVLIFLALLCFNAYSQSTDFIWAKQFGGTGYERAQSIAIDNDGNIYTTGYFIGTIDFDPGPGVFDMTSFGNYDAFVTKLDFSGNFIWAAQLGGSAWDKGFSISVDPIGNVYSTGYFSGSGDFDPGPSPFNLLQANGGVIYVSKLDASGNFVWAKQIGGTTSYFGSHIATDSNGNAYITGYFGGTADFDPSTSVSPLSSPNSYDIFVCKLDANGNFNWAKQFGGDGFDIPYTMKVKPGGSVYIAGKFESVADFDPDIGTYNLTSFGGSDAFVALLNPSGSLSWVKQIGGTSEDIITSIDFDEQGSVYATGYFYGVADFDPGIGIRNLNSSEGNAFL